MLTLWYARRAREQNRRINRMMRDLPISQAHAKPSPPEPMKLPDGWLTQKRLWWLDRALAVLLLALSALLVTVAVFDTILH